MYASTAAPTISLAGAQQNELLRACRAKNCSICSPTSTWFRSKPASACSTPASHGIRLFPDQRHHLAAARE
jgi:hypothetical protein